MMLHRLVALLLAALALCLPAIAQQRDAATPAARPTAEGEVIVKFKADAGTLRAHVMAARSDASATQLVLARRAGALGQRIGQALESGAAAGERIQVVRAAGVDANVLAQRLAADPEVEYAVPNRRAHRMTVPNDPLYLPNAGAAPKGPDSGQWYLRAPTDTVKSAIDIETAWTQTRGSPSVVVALLDTGIRFDHPDIVRVALGGNVLPGYDFVTDVTAAGDGDGRDADATDPGDWCGTGDVSSWHGTATASLIAAATDNGVGMAGTAPGVRLLPLRVLGKCGGSTVDILAAMRWAVGIRVPGIVPEINPNPARVLNMSLGSECTAGTPCTCGTDYVDALAEVTHAGALVVVAAGNSDGGPVGEPGNCPGAATVAAIRHLGTKVGFSDIGPEVALAAPGGNCVNTGLGQPCLYPVLAATNTGSQGPLASAWFDSFNFEVGTSLSTPLVAGVAALMFSKQPALTPAETLVLLKTTARPFPSTGAGNGINGQPVPKCTSPSIGVVQDQCYCPNDGPLLCGAGMLNAGAALAAAAVFAPPPVVTVSATNAQPTAGTSVTLTATATPASGRTIASYAWQITAGSGFASLAAPTNAASVTLAASAAGSVTVQVTVVDSGGGSTSQTQVLTVQAAPVVAVPNSPGSGGGGTVSWAWLLGMTLAVAGLAGGGTGRRG